jgi:hypothetical protein
MRLSPSTESWALRFDGGCVLRCSYERRLVDGVPRLQAPLDVLPFIRPLVREYGSSCSRLITAGASSGYRYSLVIETDQCDSGSQSAVDKLFGLSSALPLNQALDGPVSRLQDYVQVCNFVK